ncbi:hypothetical protein [Aridibaculum aurantiacum]|uniref:hypothetical protein n=1 Tax=Aridibaculum aurantiacum TaxID=2810307 RepID=UPI001A9706AE|nr:hypothetical protein [Aridibaculum aurantiacum]
MRVDKNKDYKFEEDQYLYKYMDLHRLMYFLLTGKLFFSPLSYFDDPLEGISENLLYQKRRSAETGGGANDEKDQLDTKNLYNNYLQEVQQTLFASCWFLGVRESQAMWETYSNSDSVALRFKPHHLCDVMINNFRNIEDSEFEAMVHGPVEYYKISPFDPADEGLKNCGHKYTGFLKDISYKHEEEFRFLLMRTEDTRHCEFFEFCPGALKDLEFDVISHPNMQGWKYNNIYNILETKGLEDRLLKSQVPTRRQMR